MQVLSDALARQDEVSWPFSFPGVVTYEEDAIANRVLFSHMKEGKVQSVDAHR